MYEAAASAIKQHLLFRPMTPDEHDILFTGTVNVLDAATQNYRLTPAVEHLACFQGGMFALGGKALNKPEDVLIGEKLTNGCVWAYDSTATGIMPEAFRAMACADMRSCPWDAERASGEAEDPNFPPGYAGLSDGRYMLRYCSPIPPPSPNHKGPPTKNK